MKRKLTGIILFTYLVAVFIAGCYEKEGEDESYTIDYDLSIETNSNNSYLLFFPTIHFRNQLETPFQEDHIDGDCIIRNIIDNGTFLKIEANGSVQIKFQYKGPDNYGWTGQRIGYNYTADDSYVSEYLIYYESKSNNSINISFYWSDEDIHDGYNVHLKGLFNRNGWQTISGSEVYVSKG